ncbi:hypothetical protein GGR57DRAFT_484339 [Xylariaceae sp. FL1272]|nr:hypothetical protein GGR57DRAFT_484339 [Xylariaceae sp. FL1272]
MAAASLRPKTDIISAAWCSVGSRCWGSPAPSAWTSSSASGAPCRPSVLLGYARIGLGICAVPHAGFLVGWNLVYGNILSIPSEITAICVLLQFLADFNASVSIVVFIVAFVRVFGEVKSVFALL